MAEAAEAKNYDVLVIGGGSGGLGFAKRAAKYGASVCVFENKRLGGTCVNVGCVPKKVMFNTAHVAESLKDAKSYGFSFGDENKFTFDYPALKKARDAYVKRLNGIYERGLDSRGVTLVRDTVQFVDSKTLEGSDGQKYTADRIVIACGGSPRIPDIAGKEHIATSDDFFNKLEDLPKKVAIVGAGYIAVELGHVMQTLGSDVTLFCRKSSLLRSFDIEIQQSAIRELDHANVTLEFGRRISKIEKLEDGSYTLFSVKGGPAFAGFDYVLYAIGRNPVSRSLNIDKIGLECNERGYVKSDEWEQTAVEGVFALGDVNGKIELTPVAIRAGRKLADRLYGGKQKAKCDYVNVPSVVFLDPPIGTCGLTEKQVNEQERFKGELITVYRARFRNMYYTIPNKEVKTLMKIICAGEDEKVVGIHLHGLGCDEMLQGFGVAMKMGATKEDLDSCVAIHPTAAEEMVTMKEPKRQYRAGDGTYEEYFNKKFE